MLFFSIEELRKLKQILRLFWCFCYIFAICLFAVGLMGKALSPLLKKELANLHRDSERSRVSMNVLKKYVADMDTNSIPFFLAEVSDSKQTKGCNQNIISLFEYLARIKGKDIVPHMRTIMESIVKALLLSAGSVSLQHACIRVVVSIARYGIDPLSTKPEREGIMRGLSCPLLDSLMGKAEPLTVGAALCLQALVESDNWKFASADIVNEACSIVTGALEEKETQTTAHMSLVCSLAKSNSQLLEAYGRALIKAGISILEDGVGKKRWQQCVASVQMINCLFKSVDTGILGSEFCNVIDSLDRYCLESETSLKVAVVEALETAKAKASENRFTKIDSCQKGSTSQLSSDLKYHRRRSLWSETELSCGSSKTPTFGSQESYVASYTPSVSSQESSSTILCSSPSMQSDAGQHDCSATDYSVSKVRKKMHFEDGSVDISLKDGILPMYTKESDAQYGRNGDSKTILSDIDSEQNCEVNPKNVERIEFDDFHGFLQFNLVNGDEFASKSWRPTMLGDKNMIEREYGESETQKDTMKENNSFLGTASFCWSRQHTPMENAITKYYQMARSPLTIEDFQIYSTPKKLIRCLQQSSPESACAKKQAIDKHEYDQYETSSQAERIEVNCLTSNGSDYGVRKWVEGTAIDTMEANGSNTQERNTQQLSSLWSSSVQSSDSKSSGFSSSICMDDKLKGTLPGINSVMVLKGYSGISSGKEDGLSSQLVVGSILSVKAELIGRPFIGWKRTKCLHLIWRGFICALFVLIAAMMAVKFIPGEEEQLLVPT